MPKKSKSKLITIKNWQQFLAVVKSNPTDYKTKAIDLSIYEHLLNDERILELIEILKDIELYQLIMPITAAVSAVSVEKIGELRNIRILELYGTAISDTFADTILKKSQQKKLSLKSHEITDQCFATIKINKKVRSLTLTSNKITNISAGYLAKPSKLIELNITSNEITEVFVASFETSRMRKIELHGNKIADFGPQLYASAADHPNYLAYKKYLLKLDTDKFCAQIVVSEKITKMVLSNEDLMEKLESVPMDINQVDFLGLHVSQTFAASCTANAIMYFLKKTGKLQADEKYCRSTELKIYSKIWRTPGEIADLEKTMDFLKQRGLDCVVTENKSVVDELKTKNCKYQEMYQKNFTVTDKNAVIKEGDIFKSAAENYYLLVIVINDENFPHVIAMSREQDKLIFYDPANNQTIKTDSWDGFIRQYKVNCDFTGIAIEIRKPVTLQATQQIRYFSDSIPRNNGDPFFDSSDEEGADFSSDASKQEGFDPVTSFSLKS